MCNFFWCNPHQNPWSGAQVMNVSRRKTNFCFSKAWDLSQELGLDVQFFLMQSSQNLWSGSRVMKVPVDAPRFSPIPLWRYVPFQLADGIKRFPPQRGKHLNPQATSPCRLQRKLQNHSVPNSSMSRRRPKILPKSAGIGRWVERCSEGSGWSWRGIELEGFGVCWIVLEVFRGLQSAFGLRLGYLLVLF